MEEQKTKKGVISFPKKVINLKSLVLIAMALCLCSSLHAQEMNKKTNLLYNKIVNTYKWGKPEVTFDSNYMEALGNIISKSGTSYQNGYYYYNYDEACTEGKKNFLDYSKYYFTYGKFSDIFSFLKGENPCFGTEKEKLYRAFPELYKVKDKQRIALFNHLKSWYVCLFKDAYMEMMTQKVDSATAIYHKYGAKSYYELQNCQSKELEKENKKKEIAAAQAKQRAEDEKINATIQTQQCVDLGLSVYWCGYNLGANSPEQLGDLYLWGETKPLRRRASTESLNYIRDYNRIENPFSEDIELTFYDVVKQKWGNGWHIPNKAEVRELISRCKFHKGVYKGVVGLQVTGPNGNSIFLPIVYEYILAAYKYYSSARTHGKMVPDIACGACMKEEDGEIVFGGIPREMPSMIRPVKSK